MKVKVSSLIITFNIYILVTGSGTEGNIKSYLTQKDCLPHLLHGFRNIYSNKISLDNSLYFHK